MIRRPPRSTRVRSSAASDVYKRQIYIYTNVLARVRPARTRIWSFSSFRCYGSRTCKNTCKCCTGATWRSKWACSGLLGCRQCARRGCSSLRQPRERLVELAWAPPVRSKWPVWHAQVWGQSLYRPIVFSANRYFAQSFFRPIVILYRSLSVGIIHTMWSTWSYYPL